jgi:valyl-tRNA synthetase
MSKSLGNIIDPLDMVKKYGADATRLSLIIGAAPGNDIKISEDKVRGYRNFVNKIWNISRFLQMNTPHHFSPKSGGGPSLSAADKKLLSDFKKLGKEITKNIESFRLSQAAETLYRYTWHTFADKIIEQSKDLLNTPKARASRQYVLLEIFSKLLKLLHPFTPFVTEEIYQKLSLKEKKETLMIEQWPG